MLSQRAGGIDSGFIVLKRRVRERVLFEGISRLPCVTKLRGVRVGMGGGGQVGVDRLAASM